MLALELPTSVPIGGLTSADHSMAREIAYKPIASRDLYTDSFRSRPDL